jgi:hypothetical protein
MIAARVSRARAFAVPQKHRSGRPPPIKYLTVIVHYLCARQKNFLMRGVKISHTKRKSLITSPRWNLQRQQNKFRSNVSRESHKNTERALRAVAATYLDFHASESDPGLFFIPFLPLYDRLHYKRKRAGSLAGELNIVESIFITEKTFRPHQRG